MHKKKLARAVLLALPFTLTACSGLGGEELIVKSWQGSKADDLVVAWGQPTRVVNLSDGRKVLSWGEKQSEQPPAPQQFTTSIALGALKGISTPDYVQATDVRTHSFEEAQSCVRNVIVAPTGEITGGDARGSACCVEASRGACADLVRKNPRSPDTPPA